jgi:hypothetical protein
MAYLACTFQETCVPIPTKIQLGWKNNALESLMAHNTEAAIVRVQEDTTGRILEVPTVHVAVEDIVDTNTTREY